MYLILGDSRSGTSLVARILHENGISMGDTFRGNSTANPYGYYEDEDLRRFCDGVKLGVDVDGEVLLKKKDWGGMKNPPWLTFAYKYLEPHLPKHKFIVCNRKWEDQWRSINDAINTLGEEAIYERLERTHKEIDKVTEGKERLDIQFERWFSQPGEQMKELCEFTRIEHRDELLDYVDPKLHRFK